MRNAIFYGLAFTLFLNAIFLGGEEEILQSLSPLLLLILLFFYILSSFQRSSLRRQADGLWFQRSPLHLPLLLLTLSLILSTFFSVSRGNSLRGLSLELAFLASAFLGIQLLPSRKEAERLGLLLLLLALFETFFAIGQRLFVGMERVTGTFHYATFFIDPLLVGICVILGFLFFDPLKRWQQMLLLSALPFILLALLWSGTRAVLPTLFSILLFFGFLRGRKVFFLLLLAALLLLLVLLLFPNSLRDRLLHGERDIYAFQRVRIWQRSYQVFRDHPFSGVGLKNFEFISSPYNFPVEDAVGRYAKKIEIPHNQYLLVACHSGLPALISFFLLLYFSLRSGIRLLPLGGVYAGALGGVIALLIHFLFDNPLYLPVNGFTFYLLLGLLGSRFKDSEIQRRKIPILESLNLQAIPRVRIQIYLLLFFLPLAYLFTKPVAATLYYQKTMREAKRKNYFAATQACQIASALLPSEALYHDALGTLNGMLYKETKNAMYLTEAYGRFRRSVETHPVHPLYKENFAIFLYTYRAEMRTMGMDVEDEILDQIRSAISLEPYNPFYREKLALFYAEEGRKGEAIEELEEVLTIEPRYLLARYQLILLYEALGERELAQEHFHVLISHLDQNLHLRVQTAYETDLVRFDPDLLQHLSFLNGESLSP